MISLYTIVVICLLALFAYPLAPDNSPNANRKITELAGRPPGFSSQFLMVPLSKSVPQRNFMERLFMGSPDRYRQIPINSFYFARDTIVVRHYLGPGHQAAMSIPLRSLISDRKVIASGSLYSWQMSVLHKNIQRKNFVLGTDQYGRDILSRLLLGARASIVVGFIAVVLSIGLGILLGTLAGYYRGWIDTILMYSTSLLWAVPLLILLFALSLSFGRGLLQVAVLIGLSMWAGTARLIRNQVVAIRDLPNVRATHLLGLPDMRIMLRHIMPHMRLGILALAAANFATAILLEAGLSFLGLGVQSPMSSWGLMIREQSDFLVSNRAILSFIPGITLIMLAVAFNLLAQAFREAAEEKTVRALMKY